ncbi:hypothetical protein HJG60_010969 [Phyllostomus discolor]|uniref:Uncharacterized protein n=1 Tax=Phyllostomus discolor TaxID=89673 RepID=A0A834EAD5_9CHIR|nr:hypothetical protein HJG60_010969 [Phyllostomus discolor]
MATASLSSVASCFCSPTVRQNQCRHVTQGPATGPEGTGPAGLTRPFQPLDLSYSVTLPGCLATLLTNGKQTPGSGSFMGLQCHLLLPLFFPIPGPVALQFHKLEAPMSSELTASPPKQCPLRVD